MSTGRYVHAVSHFTWLTTRAEVRAEIRSRQQYLKELRQRVSKHQGYRDDGFWQTKTHADRVEEEIRALEKRARELRKAA